MRIALVSDSHLAARAPECVRNWQAVRRAVAATAPDLTIHLGDISLDGQQHPEELAQAAAQLADWPTPLHCVHGNHDLGMGAGEEPLDAERHARCLAAFGPGQWRLDRDGWCLLGLDAQLLGSGSDAEARQWRWLEQSFDAPTDEGPPVALFLHRPLVRATGHVGLETGCYVEPRAAERLLAGPLGRRLALVASGHTHRALEAERDGVRHLWLPSTAFFIDDGWLQAGIGRDVVGFGLLTLEAPRAVRFELVEPPGRRAYRLSELACFPFF